MLKCAITGANGYLGRAISSYLLRQGHHIRTLGSKAVSDTTEFFHWQFNADLPEPALKGCDYLIHAAWDMNVSNAEDNERINVAGTRKLFTQAYKLGVKIVFISTASSYESAPTVYGRSKYWLEKEVSRYGGMSIRPGLVYGGNNGGMIGKLATLIEKSPVIPLIGGGGQEFVMVHIEDLCNAIESILLDHRRYDPDNLVLADPKQISLKLILKKLAYGMQKKPFFFSCPAWPILAVLKCMETLKITPPVKSDSLLSLLNLPKHFAVNQKLVEAGVFRSFIDS